MKTFYDFITTLPTQEDPHCAKFISMCKVDTDFPRTNDPSILAIYLYLKLDDKLTEAFQKLIMLYQYEHPERLPKRAFIRQDMALATINLIVYLQNASAEYKWH